MNAMTDKDDDDLDERDDSALDTEESDEADEYSDTDVLDRADFTETTVLNERKPVRDFVGDSSVVFQMEDIMAELEEEARMGGSAANRVRKRLEAIAERKRRSADLMDLEDYDIDA